jgi:hypothetical protein
VVRLAVGEFSFGELAVGAQVAIDVNFAIEMIVDVDFAIEVSVEVLANDEHLVLKSGQDVWGPSFAPRDAAHVRGIYAELSGHAIVEAAKNSKRGQAQRGIICVVTFHDAPLTGDLEELC